jgi:hypothetical protein
VKLTAVTLKPDHRWSPFGGGGMATQILRSSEGFGLTFEGGLVQITKRGRPEVFFFPLTSVFHMETTRGLVTGVEDDTTPNAPPVPLNAEARRAAQAAANGSSPAAPPPPPVGIAERYFWRIFDGKGRCVAIRSTYGEAKDLEARENGLEVIDGATRPVPESQIERSNLDARLVEVEHTIPALGMAPALSLIPAETTFIEEPEAPPPTLPEDPAMGLRLARVKAMLALGEITRDEAILYVSGEKEMPPEAPEPVKEAPRAKRKYVRKQP